MNDLLIKPILDRLDRGAEIGVVRDQECHVIAAVHRASEQVGDDTGIDAFFYRLDHDIALSVGSSVVLFDRKFARDTSAFD